MKKSALIFCFLLLNGYCFGQNNFSISGYVYDASNGEALINAAVHVPQLDKGVLSNVYGFYSISLPAGEVKLVFDYVGFQRQEKNFRLEGDMQLDIKLVPTAHEMKEVVISADANAGKEQVRSTRMSTITVPVEQLRTMPSIGGEVDVIKIIQLMPGVKRGGEGQTGMYVRGGTADQNLILLDEAPVYNISHLFGFFSIFNNDALKDISLIKGGFPAQYGGRVSSILDIRMKEGNTEKFAASGGIGLLSSRLTLEGPIIKDKMSFLVSGRRSYIDQVFKLVKVPLPYYFYDLNGKLNYKVGEKDRLYFSTYFGNDVLSFSENGGGNMPDSTQNDSANVDLSFDFGFKIGNYTNTLRWNHQYSPKLFSNVSLIHTRFRYDITGQAANNNLFIGSQIHDLGIKVDYDLYPNNLNQIKFGAGVTNHVFKPNIVSLDGELSELARQREPELINTQEYFIYGGNDQRITEKLTLNYGFRASAMTTQKKVYYGPEPRFSTSYAFDDYNSVKFGVSRMYQYMHLVSNSSIALPTDLWYPVTGKVKPQYSDQVATGYTHFFSKLNTIFTVEGYYKWMHNLIEYKEGAVLILNDNYENELLHGKGDAYGVELFLNRTRGRINGWIGYTLSWATRDFDQLNRGRQYFAKYDRRHDLSIVGNFDISKRITFSAVWVYSTGQRFTGRIGQFIMPSPDYTTVGILPIYTDRNAMVFSSSHRLDVNLVIKRKPGKKWDGDWNVGFYNFYNRTQPYRVRVSLDEQSGKLKYEQVGLFGRIFSIGYNFRI